jgi:hypothetical protein
MVGFFRVSERHVRSRWKIVRAKARDGHELARAAPSIGVSIRVSRGTAMRGEGSSRCFLGAASMLLVAFACNGQGFSGDGDDSDGASGEAGSDDGASGAGTAARGGASASGGASGAVGTGGGTSGGATTGGATTGGATTSGGTGGRATGGTMTSGGTDAGGTATGGRATGGMTTGGAAGQGDGGAGRSNGGSSSGSGAAAGLGGAGTGGASAGAGGQPTGCENAVSCTVCCDELYPDGHLDFAGRFYNCGCGSTCSNYCLDFCGSTYNWSSDCLACILQVPMSSSECVAATNACGENATCSRYRACLLSCG